MATTHRDTNVNQLVINKMTKQEYNNLSQVSDTELYLVEEQVDNVVTQNSTNPVQSGAVYNAIQDNHEIIFCHMLDGEIFNETVIECTEVDGEIFDPQELIDRPDEPRPLFPDGNYYYATNTNKVYGGEVGDSDFTDVTASVMIEGDETKLYCDIDSNKLYRYDGADFVMVGGGGEITIEEDSTTNALLPIVFDDTNNNLKHSSTKMTFNPSTGLIQGACMELTGGRVTGSGDDEGLVISTASNNYAGLCLGSPSGSRSVFYFSTSNGTSAMWRYNNGTSSFDLKHPGTSGTIPVVWAGTLAQYNAITTKNAYTIYLISD